MAAGTTIGGIFVEKVSLSSVTWIGALGVTIAIVAIFSTFSRTVKQDVNREKNKQ